MWSNFVHQPVQSSAERWSPGCVNAAGKAWQKWWATEVTKFNKSCDLLLAWPCTTLLSSEPNHTQYQLRPLLCLCSVLPMLGTIHKEHPQQGGGGWPKSKWSEGVLVGSILLISSKCGVGDGVGGQLIQNFAVILYEWPHTILGPLGGGRARSIFGFMPLASPEHAPCFSAGQRDRGERGL